MLRHLAAALLVLAAPPALAAPSDEMFAKLKAATEESEAAGIAEDIWAAWGESGSPTADLLMQRASEAAAFGDAATSRELLDRVILLKPGFAEAYHRRAGLFLKAENFPEAFRDLNQALTLEPRHFGAWLGMGVMFEALGGQRQALESYREALAIYPLMPQARAAVSRIAREAEGQEL